MILFSIRRIDDKRYFIGFDGRGRSMWNKTPRFVHQAETIAKHLKRLCGEYIDEPYQWRCNGRSFTYYRRNWKNFDYTKLKDYEIVKFDVKILGNEILEVKKFITTKELKKFNVVIR